MGIFSIIGTGLGAAGGFIVGGPAGAAVGAKIGGSIGSGADTIRTSGRAQEASREAAREQELALGQGITEQRTGFGATREDIAPFLETGQQADQRLRDILLGNTALTAPDIPGLEQAREAGLSAVEGSAFANRQGLSGRTLASLFNQGQAFDFGASTDFLNRLQNLSGRGLTAATTTGQFRSQKSSNVANLLASQGDVRASGIVGANNAFQRGQEGLAKAGSDLFAAIFPQGAT